MEKSKSGVTGENARLDITQLEAVQRQHVLLVLLLKSQSRGHYSARIFGEKTPDYTVQPVCTNQNDSCITLSGSWLMIEYK